MKSPVYNILMNAETAHPLAVSIKVMAKRLAFVLLLIFAAICLFLAYRWYDNLPWLEASISFHSERGSTNCGHLTNSGYGTHPDSASVIHCVESAHRQHRPFFVTLSIVGGDAFFSSAIVGNSKGDAIEIFYWSGYVIRANKLFKRRCNVSGQFLVLSGDRATSAAPLLSVATRGS